ncbi:MAG: lysine exporter LysO family protein [Rikenellaceae bacterium]
MKGSIIIVSFFAIGVLLSFYGFIPEFLVENDFSIYVLMALMFCVGITIGSDSRIVSAVREYGFKILTLPVATVLGTLVAMVVASTIFTQYSIWDCMAVGSGFGYYSLSSIVITEYKGAELGTIALMSNVIREILTLLFAPFIVVAFGKLAPIAAGGATTADTTLPIISKVSGKEFVIVAIVHGISVDLSVIILVPFFCGL